MRALLCACLFVVLTACTSPASSPTASPTGTPSAAPTVSPTSSPTVVPSVSPTVVPFGAGIARLSAGRVAGMTGVSWRPGCPVPPAELRLVTVTYWGFDGAPHRGELVVHEDMAGAFVRVFERLYRARFPIRAMVPVEAYHGSDDASMAADNTSAFNCRYVAGTRTWSAHAYGRAVDVNPVENPYLVGGRVLPPAGRAYLDRRDARPGMVLPGDAVTRAFAAEGFRWGATFGEPDYQHFDRR